VIPLYRTYLDRKTTQYYGYLAVVERNSESMNSEQLEDAIKEVEQIESGLIRVKLPPAYMPKVYAARAHTGMVLGRLRARRAKVSMDYAEEDGEGDGDGDGTESDVAVAEA
jgi:hypothetical protein